MKMSIPHCARGPKRCEECKARSEIKEICLVKIFFKPRGITSPIIELILNGKKGYYEFEVIKIFKDENAARNYARKNKIPIDLKDKN